MLADALVISFKTFGTLSARSQADILKAMGSSTAEVEVEPAHTSSEAAKFSINKMREFLNGVSDKTRTVLEGVAAMESRFNVGELLDKLGMQYGDLRGVLAGLTKRTRTISGDSEALFFVSIVWDDDIRKCVSEVHPVTHAALKKLLNVA